MSPYCPSCLGEYEIDSGTRIRHCMCYSETLRLKGVYDSQFLSKPRSKHPDYRSGWNTGLALQIAELKGKFL